MAFGTGNLLPGVLFITLQVLSAMETVEFQFAHKGFMPQKTQYSRKRRNRPVSFHFMREAPRDVPE
jgi:hypothetical protein